MTIVSNLHHDFYHFFTVGETVFVIVFYIDDIVIVKTHQHIFNQFIQSR